MKKSKKILSLVLVFAMCLSCMSLNAFALNDPDTDTYVDMVVAPRSETGTVLRTTNMWNVLPYSEIDNDLLCVLDSGDSVFVYSYDYDHLGNLWTYCVVTSCARDDSVEGFAGWIDASDLAMRGT